MLIDIQKIICEVFEHTAVVRSMILEELRIMLEEHELYRDPV